MKTSTERVKDMRERNRAIGLLRTEYFVHRDDRERVSKLVAMLARKREKMAG